MNYIKANKTEIGERIRARRKEFPQFNSQDKFLDEMRVRGYKTMNRKKLSKIENGDEEAINSLSIETLENMCDCLDCDIYWLLGLTDCHTIEKDSISKQLGLCEAAIDNIISIDNKNHFSNAITLNELLKNPKLKKLLSAIEVLIVTSLDHEEYREVFRDYWGEGSENEDWAENEILMYEFNVLQKLKEIISDIKNSNQATAIYRERQQIFQQYEECIDRYSRDRDVSNPQRDEGGSHEN